MRLEILEIAIYNIVPAINSSKVNTPFPSLSRTEKRFLALSAAPIIVCSSLFFVAKRQKGNTVMVDMISGVA